MGLKHIPQNHLIKHGGIIIKDEKKQLSKNNEVDEIEKKSDHKTSDLWDVTYKLGSLKAINIKNDPKNNQKCNYGVDIN